MSGTRPRADGLSDQELIDALSEAARAVAAEGANPLLLTQTGELPRHRWPGMPRRWRLAVVAGMTAVAAAVVFGPRLVRRAPLTFEVRGGAVERGGYVSVAGGEASQSIGQVHFSDGTEIDLLDGESRLSVVAPSARGARLRLDAGRAHFRVRHLPQAAWSVEAGPYVVQVTGTVFDVRWSSRDELVEVDLHAGSVRVAGPGLSDAVPLRAGQRLSARPAKGEVKIEALVDVTPAREGAGAAPDQAPPQSPPSVPAAAAPPPLPSDVPLLEPPRGGASPLAGRSPRQQPRSVVALLDERQVHRTGAAAAASPASPTSAAVPAPPPGTEPPPLPPPPVVPAAPAAPRSEPAWTHRPWSENVGAGDAAGVLADAERIGVGLTLERADSANLDALADAARYQARPELARRALLQQRARFAGTREAERAAFVLGRMADDGGDFAESMRWYGRYLAEAPRGAYADEALGRLMLVIQRREGTAAAAALASDYLRRFPNGTYLLQARAIRAGR